MAASATFALKVAVWFRRGRLFMVSPDSLGTACPLSGRNSTYRSVQISETSSNVFNSSFTQVGTIATPAAIGALNLIPFNVQSLSNGTLAVTYAPPGRAAQAIATLGMGAVGIFDESGNLLRTMVGGPLAAPWGITIAPANFGPFSGDLLVGNFSSLASEINAFDPLNGTFLGTIPINVGIGNTPGGLWALEFGTG